MSAVNAYLWSLNPSRVEWWVITIFLIPVTVSVSHLQVVAVSVTTDILIVAFGAVY